MLVSFKQDDRRSAKAGADRRAEASCPAADDQHVRFVVVQIFRCDTHFGLKLLTGTETGTRLGNMMAFRPAES